MDRTYVTSAKRIVIKIGSSSLTGAAGSQLDAAAVEKIVSVIADLKARGVEHIEEVRIDLSPEQRDHMMNLTGRRTVPQIFIGDHHVGGCDDLIALDSSGGLMPLLEAN